MAVLKQMVWSTFEKTGSIDTYLLLKELETPQETSPATSSEKDMAPHDSGNKS